MPRKPPLYVLIDAVAEAIREYDRSGDHSHAGGPYPGDCIRCALKAAIGNMAWRDSAEPEVREGHMITFNDITAEHSEHTFCVYQMLQRALLEADADIRRAEQALLAMRANRQRLHDTSEHTFALYKAQTQEEKSQ